jgi:hypothetical protein
MTRTPPIPAELWEQIPPHVRAEALAARRALAQGQLRDAESPRQSICRGHPHRREQLSAAA